MSDDPYADRRRLSFEQAEGAEALPTQLRPKELSRQVRALLWLRVHTSLVSDSGLDFSFMGAQWRTILFDNFVQREHHMADEFVSNESVLIASVKAIFSSGNYLGVFGFLQFVLRHPRCPYGFAQQIDNALKVSRAAYRVLGGDTIVPVASEAERATIERALADLASKEFQGARSHLRTSGSELTNGGLCRQCPRKRSCRGVGCSDACPIRQLSGRVGSVGKVNRDSPCTQARVLKHIWLHQRSEGHSSPFVG